MTLFRRKDIVLLLLIVSVLMAASCRKRVAAVTPPPAPPRPPEPPKTPDKTISQLFLENVHEIRFDYDKADIRPDQVATLQNNATWLKQNASVRFTLEGHCDERGSEEYNLGLGDRRANA